ncbi:MAG: hypothetical protein HY665_08435 [Chloroflexi bacterium]|nr:hypothetical protein [Chloroflexota bacterium]
MNGTEEKEKQHFCPYCDNEMEVEWPFCQTCGVTVFHCPRCRKPFSREHKVCPYCGAELKVAAREGE